ncbi:hypothetical protein ANANG_G00167900 [Anguilla anguilla]|uniref:G-protein coupled receptors family 3 profile domain-containing protein n=1 Tax=Anguilla anguilla TaxID=7936 RepID=A0A9D3RSS5_ANGAN|nr:hypothetical protein ANANG_G00167900 [Anguilla anguilla]
MAVFLISLLLQLGFAAGSNYGYVEWSEQDKDLDVKGQHTVPNTHVNKESQHNPTYFTKPWTERNVVAHRIEEDLPRVVTAFLHTGDSATLKHVNCSRRYELSSLRGRSYIAPHYPLHSVLETVAHATNFLNMILQANSSREHTLRRDVMWYHALVRSILEGDPKIHRAVLTFNTESPTPGPHIFLQATRTDSDIVLQDLSDTAHRRLKNKTPETEWFNEFRDKKQTHVRRRVPSQDVKATDASVRRGDRYVLDKTQIKWSAPYLECENGNFIPHWLLTLSAGFYSLKPNLVPEFRGVVRVDVNLQDLDIDQCSANGWFAGTHRCNLTTMECQPVLGHGFVLDKYKCQCKQGFYHPSRVAVNGFKRTEKTGARHRGGVTEGPAKCLPCREGCAYCRDDTPCHAQPDDSLRLAVISFQALCMLGDLVSMLVAYHFRRNKRIRASGLILMEAILFGALLMYFPVVILFFAPSVFRCVLLRWVRLLGFAVVYGTVILKLYRVLKVFLSRTAQRIPYMTSCRVLRLLVVILLVVSWFLVAWTLAVCQNMGRDLSPITVGVTQEGLQFSLCLLDRWDYMMAVAEFLFLLWGVYLCYAVRTVPSAFHEPRYLAVAIYNELVISAVFHIVRFTLAPALHPDWMLMLIFGHTHLTVTVTLGLLLIPKFLFTATHTRDDLATEAYEEELDMGRSGSYLNSSITSAWSEHSLDPEDIREELKKLYSQLEIYKRKKMLANNPHLQKKRSSKKGLGRSLMRRITEIPNDEPPHKVFSLHKSHSSYDHHALEQGEAEGKMAAATDGKMAADGRAEASTPPPPPPRTLCRTPGGAEEGGGGAEEKASEGKSLSVIASARERTLGLTGRIHGAGTTARGATTTPGEGRRRRGGKGRPEAGGKPEQEQEREREREPEQRYPKMSVSQSVEYRRTAAKAGIMRQQVSGSQPSICSEPGRAKDLYDLSEVCPWEAEAPPPRRRRRPTGGRRSTCPSPRRDHRGPRDRPQGDGGAAQTEGSRPPASGGGRLAVCHWEEEEEEEEGEEEGAGPQAARNRGDRTPQRPEMRLWGAGDPVGGAGGGAVPRPEQAEEEPCCTPGLRADICPWDYDTPPSSPSTPRARDSARSKKKGGASAKTSSEKEREKERGKDKDEGRRRSKSKEKGSSGRSSEKRRVSQSKMADGCPCDGVGGAERRKSSGDRGGPRQAGRNLPQGGSTGRGRGQERLGGQSQLAGAEGSGGAGQR